MGKGPTVEATYLGRHTFVLLLLDAEVGQHSMLDTLAEEGSCGQLVQPASEGGYEWKSILRTFLRRPSQSTSVTPVDEKVEKVRFPALCLHAGDGEEEDVAATSDDAPSFVSSFVHHRNVATLLSEVRKRHQHDGVTFVVVRGTPGRGAEAGVVGDHDVKVDKKRRDSVRADVEAILSTFFELSNEKCFLCVASMSSSPSAVIPSSQLESPILGRSVSVFADPSVGAAERCAHGYYCYASLPHVNGEVRKDRCSRFDKATVLNHGCLGVVSSSQMWRDVVFQAGLTPKYGA
mmetsp:Transcript_36272/g.94327  ORF Transcript_36272/g.94327 Transcript_36272/m.94327 type:complete len:291 (-) Transcript_36272:480-1352(-)